MLAGLESFLPRPRLARYEAAVAGSEASAIELYGWAADVALAAFADVTALEVVLRSRIAEKLVSTYGLAWYERADIFDEDSMKQISAAWAQGGLQKLQDETVDAEVLNGKLVASFTFGFWVQLMGRGGYQGIAPFRGRRIYDTSLWRPVLSHAMPNAPGRVDAEHAARRVQALRNRVAHHEHIIWGVPVKGTERLTLRQAHSRIITLATYIDPAFGSWISEHSALPQLLSAAPIQGPWSS